MTTVWLDAVFKPFFKIVHDTGQQMTINRTNFLTDSFLQIIQRTGFVSVNTPFQIPPKKKITPWKIGRTRGPRHVSETGNELPRKHVSNSGHWLVCSVRCGSIDTDVANSEEKNADHLIPLQVPPTEYYRFKRCQYSAYLLSTTHSKDVRFPLVTLYIHKNIFERNHDFILFLFSISTAAFYHRHSWFSSQFLQRRGSERDLFKKAFSALAEGLLRFVKQS